MPPNPIQATPAPPSLRPLPSAPSGRAALVSIAAFAVLFALIWLAQA